MEASRFFEWFQFAALVCLGLVGLSRALLLYARGIPVIAADRQRTPLQMVVDTLALVCLLVWAYEIVACAWSFHFHAGPIWLRRVLVDSVTVKVAGTVFVSVALVLYVIALGHLGKSWRMGIDRTTPGHWLPKAFIG